MISIDRFLLVSVKYPRYVKIQTHFRIKLTLLIGWIFSLLTSVVELSMWEVAKGLDYTASIIDYNKYCLSPPRRMKQFALTFFLLFYLFPVLLVCGISMAFFCLLQKRLSRNWKISAEPSQSTSSSISHQSGPPQQIMSMQQRNRYIKLATTLLALVTAMAVCMLPYSLYVVAVEVFCHRCENKDILYSVCQ